MKNIYDIALNAAQETREVVLNEMRNNALWTLNDYLQSAWWRTRGEVRTVVFTLAMTNLITSTDMNAIIRLVESVDNWDEKNQFPDINPYTEKGQANMARLLEEWNQQGLIV